MTYNVFGGTLNLAQSILISRLVISAGASLSQPPLPPERHEFFSNFLATFFSCHCSTVGLFT